MKLKKSGIAWKIASVIRFYTAKIFHYRRFLTRNVSALGSGIRLIIEKPGKIILGGRLIVLDNVELQSKGYLSIGGGTTINRFSRIVAFDSIEIGENVMFAQFVTVLDHDHQFSYDGNNLAFSGYETKPISIGNNVWLGEKVTILKGSNIGSNVIVAAHSVVSGNVPPNCVVGGVPAKIIRKIT